MEEEVTLGENIIFGIGEVLLDLVANVDDEFLTKYGLNNEDEILANEKHYNLFEEVVERHNVTYCPGGSVYNTMKIFQWMLRGPKNVCTFFCSVGNDETGEMIRRDAERRKIDAHFYEVDNVPTGTCAILVNNAKYTIVSKLDSAKLYIKEKHLDLPENWKLVEQAEYYYLCGYFLTVCPDSVLKVGKYAAENNKWFLFNLSASRIIRTFKNILLDLLKYADFIFCNDIQAKSIAEVFGYPSDNLEDVAKWLRELPKENTKKDRVVIVTCNKNDTIAATVEGINLYPVVHVDEKDIVDTCGAGDAFAGGFLSQFIQEKPLEDCIRAAHYTASVTIKQVSCSVPEFKPNFKF